LNSLGDIARARGDLDAALRYKTEELSIDLQLGDPEVIRSTYADAIDLADEAGAAAQAAAWRAALIAFERDHPASETDTGDHEDDDA
jgi:hypothetical protein